MPLNFDPFIQQAPDPRGVQSRRQALIGQMQGMGADVPMVPPGGGGPLPPSAPAAPMGGGGPVPMDPRLFDPRLMMGRR